MIVRFHIDPSDVMQQGNYDYRVSYQSMWIADIVLAALAALCNLPIREENVSVRLTPA